MTEHMDYLSTPKVRVLDAVVASMAVPGFVNPIPIGDAYYFDGGFFNNISQPWETGEVLQVIVGSGARPTAVIKPSEATWEACTLRMVIQHMYAKCQVMGQRLAPKYADTVVTSVKIPAPEKVAFMTTHISPGVWNHLYLNGLLAGIHYHLSLAK